MDIYQSRVSFIVVMGGRSEGLFLSKIVDNRRLAKPKRFSTKN